MVSQMKAPATSDIVRYPYACREGRLECRAHQSNDEARLGQGRRARLDKVLKATLAGVRPARGLFRVGSRWKFKFEVYRPGGYPGMDWKVGLRTRAREDADGGYERTQDHGLCICHRTQDPSSAAAESRRDCHARLPDLSVAWKVAR